ncbi:hypothetical protein Amsp01_088180 [Amycolatopsis sp. NBRC 101858]|uniref:hypothetical protein n=1 Tax=Amycolatopsis sp. NBRC 101858 TaxID=3032200 RepID=UPI0024A4D128|nr:hypothetical protein [Amycolatopsis sp. NBRC 101858]GLY42795.1 hypothetical protein Amsp01_088180 [Amycolatopsis sp. NBRC 101858]
MDHTHPRALAGSRPSPGEIGHSAVPALNAALAVAERPPPLGTRLSSGHRLAAALRSRRCETTVFGGAMGTAAMWDEPALLPPRDRFTVWTRAHEVRSLNAGPSTITSWAKEVEPVRRTREHVRTD